MNQHHKNRVRTARLKAGLSQAQAAWRAGVSLSTFVIADKYGALSQRTAEKLAPVLGCQVEDLLPPRRQP